MTMPFPHPQPDQAADIPVLRVLGGPRAGATRPLETGMPVTLGTRFGADILLRGDAAPFAAELRATPGRPIGLAVTEGEAELLGIAVPAGQRCLWPAFTPLRVGPHVLAHGPADSPRWADADTLLDTLAPGHPTADPEPAPDPATPAFLARIPASARRPLCGGIAIAAMLSAIAISPAPSFPHLLTGSSRAERILADEGLTGLAVETAPDGIIRINGTVPSQAALARASAGLQAAGIAHALDVTTGDMLADAAADVARVHGIPATARLVGDRAVALTVAPIDPDRRQRLIQAIRADVPDITRLTIEDGLEATDDAAPRTVSEAAKRVATVVAGDPGYVLTADGGRYFPGATMPSGHVLRAIEDGAILVERNGATTRIRF